MTSPWLAALLVLAACTDPRRLVLSIDTNAGVPCDIDRIRIRASASETTTFERAVNGLPLEVTLLDETPDGSLQVEVTGLKGSDEVMQVAGPVQFGGHEVRQPVMLDVNCNGSPACALSGAMAGAPAPPTTARFRCGPRVQRYTAAMTSADATDVCHVLTPHAGKVLADGSRGPVRLMDLEPLLPGFAFQFYGQPIHQIWVARDGYLSFNGNRSDPNGDLAPGAFDRSLKKLGPPPPPLSVMAFWDNLSMSSLGVCYELDGAPGSQTLRVAWTHACLTAPCGSDNLNFMITLDESNQQVVVSYGTMVATPLERARGATATVGLFHDAASCPVGECVLETGLCEHSATPCGYSQASSYMAHMDGLPSTAFSPVAEPR